MPGTRLTPLRLRGGWFRPWAVPLLAALLAACSSSGEERPRRVLLISLDTLAASHCGFLGYPRDTTPFLDELAARGVVFERHFANSNTTLPSHASMLTGLFVPAHGVRDGGTPETRQPLPPRAETLAERLRDAGYRTLGFTAHAAWLNPAFGFDRGFEHFETGWRAAPETIEAFLSRLDALEGEPTFAFLHFFDAHSESSCGDPCFPYASDDPWRERFAGPTPEGFTGCSARLPDACASEYLKAVSNHIDRIPPEHLEFLIGLYDAGVAQLDAELRRLFDELERRGWLEDALVVVTADHGEAFMEHGRMLHGVHFEEVSRVPLIVVPPARLGARPRRVHERTQSVDLVPTVLDLCGLAPAGQGRSLARTIVLGEPPEPRDVLFESNVLVTDDERGEFKLVATPDGPKFFDHTSDPGEFEDRAALSPLPPQERSRIAAAEARLADWLERCEAVHGAVAGGAAGPELTPDQVRELRALGYF